MRNIKLRTVLPDVAAILFFLCLSLAYFFTPVSEGLVLGGHDTQASVGQGRELTAYHAETGDYTRWVNNIFSGMPTYQISPSYKSNAPLSFVQQLYAVGTSGPVMYLFLYLLGFYILLRAFDFRSYLAALGAVLWAFSSYFLIIIAAGHIWKVMTLAFIPPTIAGLVLTYRGKYLWGGAVTALFTAFQIHANHPQMSYYFFFLMAFIVLAYGVSACIKKKTDTAATQTGIGRMSLQRWGKSTLVFTLAGLLGVAANLPSLYHTYDYAQQSMRGPAELTPTAQDAAKAPTKGLDRDYITQWSYGISETMTLMIPDFKGGGSRSIMERPNASNLPGYSQFMQNAGALQQAMQQSGQSIMPPGVMQYWGNQPFTVGPVYVGAIVCLLFFLGLFIVRTPMKWALLLGTLLSLMMAWGHNFPAFTNFCIDHLPLYSKFRTPSSALVVAELTLPLLGMMALARIIRRPQMFYQEKYAQRGAIVSVVLTLGVCIVLWLFPSAAGSCLSGADQQTLALLQAQDPMWATQYSQAVTKMHHAILSGSARYAAFILLLGIGLIGWYVYKNRPSESRPNSTAPTAKGAWVLCLSLLFVCLADLWHIDKRYLNNDSFTDAVSLQQPVATAADSYILKDKSDYRVVDLSQGSPFNETSNHSCYFHQSIGGYNAAKLHRYQDLIERQLVPQIQASAQALSTHEGDTRNYNADSVGSVLNMLNTKYFIFGQSPAQVVLNTAANGNAWFVRHLDIVSSADEEMADLGKIDTKTTAVVSKEFSTALEGSALDSGRVELTERRPNELHYTAESQKGGVLVMSEIYYPGWTATVDGKTVDIARVDYVLRAIRLEGGKHEVVLTYRPTSVSTTEAIAYGAVALIFLLFAAALWRRLAVSSPAKETPDAV